MRRALLRTAWRLLGLFRRAEDRTPRDSYWLPKSNDRNHWSAH